MQRQSNSSWQSLVAGTVCFITTLEMYNGVKRSRMAQQNGNQFSIIFCRFPCNAKSNFNVSPHPNLTFPRNCSRVFHPPVMNKMADSNLQSFLSNLCYETISINRAWTYIFLNQNLLIFTDYDFWSSCVFRNVLLVLLRKASR